MKKSETPKATDHPDLYADEEAILTKKLEEARKQANMIESEKANFTKQEQVLARDEEAAEAAEAPPTADALEEQREALYGELEKMGCSRNYLVKMKERHGTVIVYPHEDSKWFVIRPLKVKEMRMIREIAGPDTEKLNREILEAACIFPRLSDEAIGELPAGLPDLLVNMISRLSAFIPVELAFTLSKEL